MLEKHCFHNDYLDSSNFPLTIQTSRLTSCIPKSPYKKRKNIIQTFSGTAGFDALNAAKNRMFKCVKKDSIKNKGNITQRLTTSFREYDCGRMLKVNTVSLQQKEKPMLSSKECTPRATFVFDKSNAQKQQKSALHRAGTPPLKTVKIHPITRPLTDNPIRRQKKREFSDPLKNSYDPYRRHSSDISMMLKKLENDSENTFNLQIEDQKRSHRC